MLEDEGLEILSEEECRNLVGMARVGRVGVTMGAVAAIFPVNFAVLDGDIVFRTGTGTKLDAATRNSVVAFEVDRIDAVYEEGWSVFVVGAAEEVHDPKELEHVRQLDLPTWAGGARDRVVRIRPDFMSGRRIVQPPAVQR
jgi:nitroimidazol reductase NimA-like FMN-containing flavoprotein (pyridoxamine 5'-phosphate oxidase superfamily)